MRGRVRFARQSIGTARSSFCMHRALNEHHLREALDRVDYRLSLLHPAELRCHDHLVYLHIVIWTQYASKDQTVEAMTHPVNEMQVQKP